jgi:phosphate starvation-inducible PhoH-like protein
MKHKHNQANTRKAKQEKGIPRDVSLGVEEFKKAKPIQAKNEFQKKILKAAKNDKIKLIVVLSSAGCGKNYIVMSTIADWYAAGNIDKIIISRPAVGMGPTLGYLKGDMEDKFNPYLMPLIEVFTDRYGKGKYETALAAGNIEMIPLEYMRGRNINGVAVVDEAQNVTPEQMYSVITRLTENGRMFIIGDPTQTDLKKECGLTWLKNFVKKHNLEEYIEVIEGTSDDIVRGELCKAFVKAKESEQG